MGNRLKTIGSLLLAGGIIPFTSPVLADSDTSTVLPYTCGTRITPSSPAIAGTRYGRILRLEHSGSVNGTLLATFEAWPNNFGIYRSTDDGVNWTQIATTSETQFAGYQFKVEPDLFELPVAMGNLPAGTVLLAGNAPGPSSSRNLEIYYSLDHGLTWKFRSVVQSNDATHINLWEPYLGVTSAGQLICYYSDERFTATYNQVLSERVSPDGGLTWGTEQFACAIPDGVQRPGMAVVTRMGNGKYVMSFEAVNGGARSQVHIKFSDDGINWGSGPADYGTPVQTASGAYLGACPYIVWVPAGGPNGTLVLAAQFLVNSPNTDRELLINTHLGQGNWTMIPAPVQWQGGGNVLAGWSQGMIPTADGQGVIQLASSQITLNGNTNNNEMLVGRAQLILPGNAYVVANQNSGLALEIPGNSPTHGVGFQQGLVNGGPAQKWRFNDLGNNVWTVINSANRLAWDNTGWSVAPGTKIEQWDYNGLPVQQWKLRPVGNGAWRFLNVYSGLAITVTNAATAAGAAIIQWSNAATAEQNWLPSQPDFGLAAHYTFDGNVQDATGHGNDGSPAASTTNYVTGRFGGYALRFNGTNDYVQIPRSIGGGNCFAIAFWMKTTSIGGGSSTWIGGSGLVDGDVWGSKNDFGISLLNGKIAFGVGNPETTLQSTLPVNDGQWHHVVAMRDGFNGRMAIYLDGLLNTNAPGPIGAKIDPPVLRIGSIQNGISGKYFDGVIDEVRLYNNWLDTNTIAQLATQPSLLAWLKFDEASATTAIDSTGNGWNGTLVNGPTRIAGHTGLAVNLNASANNYVSLPAGVAGSLNSCTMAAWVRPNNSGTWSRIFDFGDSPTNYLFLSPVGGGNIIRFAMTTTAGAGEQGIDYQGALSSGVWHHLAVTLDSGIGILYVDGAPVATNQTLSLAPADLGNTVQNWIGRSQYPDPYLNGAIDDFRIYQGALSLTDVASFVTPLAAPTGLTAASGDAAVGLTWDALPSAAGFNVKRARVSGGPYTTIASNLPATEFTDGVVTNGIRYFYVVTATNPVMESARSAEVSAVPAPRIPPQLTVLLAAGQLHFSWPTDHTGWLLQCQTNDPGTGLGTNWITVPNSGAAVQFDMPVNPANGSIFFRLAAPN